ncbi:MAG: hypothetical protein ACRDJ9_31055, partial [Dehalococcoidia bacterium]
PGAADEPAATEHHVGLRGGGDAVDRADRLQPYEPRVGTRRPGGDLGDMLTGQRPEATFVKSRPLALT